MPRRKDWEAYHAAITDAYLTIFADKKRPPTMKEVADATGISLRAIQNHFKSITIQNVAPAVKARMGRVLHGLANAGEKGDAASAKLFAQLVFGWKEGMILEQFINDQTEDARTKLKNKIDNIIERARKKQTSPELN